MPRRCALISGRPALVLGGGAILGALQVGVVKVLFQAGLTPSLIVGTSAGALNGAFIAFHPDSAGIEKLEQVRRDLERLSNRARITVIHPQLDHEHPITAVPHMPHLIEEGERLGQQLLGRCLGEGGRLRPGLVVN